MKCIRLSAVTLDSLSDDSEGSGERDLDKGLSNIVFSSKLIIMATVIHHARLYLIPLSKRLYYHRLKKSIYIEVSLTTVSFQTAGSNGSASESSASCKGVYPIEGGPPSLLLFPPMVS